MKAAFVVVLVALAAGAQARNIAINWLPNGMPQLELVKPAVRPLPEVQPLPEILPLPVVPRPEVLPLPLPVVPLPEILPAPQVGCGIKPEVRPLPPISTFPIEMLPEVRPEVRPLPPISTFPIEMLPEVRPEVRPLPPIATFPIEMLPEVRPEVRPLPPIATFPIEMLPEVRPEVRPVPPMTKPIIEWTESGFPQILPGRPPLPEIIVPEIVVPQTKPLPAPSTKPQIEVTYLPNGMPQFHLVKPSTEAIVRPERPSVQPPQILVPEVKPLPAPSTKPQIVVTYLPNGMPQFHLVKPSTEAIVRPERPSVQPPQILVPEVKPVPEVGCVIKPEVRPEVTIPEIGVFPAPGAIRPEVRPVLPEFVPSIERPQIIF